ncbi:TetR/AcrR family transcriptional regulator [Streptomyces sp. SM12]|uniref:TetR/AcrR family transcriptional regulator n=1 Tax=Streptomyces sp. SM12 TaxID=1071602 RepID=UPI0021560BBE|nr:helix-turn-helix domain-containing protein [Streptomyces sp. SM12]
METQNPAGTADGVGRQEPVGNGRPVGPVRDDYGTAGASANAPADAPADATTSAPPGEGGTTEAGGGGSPLRTDARRNLQHVLDAARDVFGEQGYDAPVEEVARRAQVGVGTVYRRFPNKEALVRYITEQETRRLAERALAELSDSAEPWQALERLVRYAVAARSGKLLPELFAAGSAPIGGNAPIGGSAPVGGKAPIVGSTPVVGSELPRGVRPVGAPHPGSAPVGPVGGVPGAVRPDEAGPDRVPQPRSAPESGTEHPPPEVDTAPAGRSVAADPIGDTTTELLGLLAHLVERARLAQQLRADATVADVLLVIATAPPPLADPNRRAMVAERLLDILLQGLRPARR